MEHQSTENLNPSEEKGDNKKSNLPPEIRGVIETSNKKPTPPKWWDVLGWILRLVVALGTLLKLLKDRD